MRVVAGTARGRRLRTPDGASTRPTSDRVREAVFNALFSLDALRDALVVDLYAGSGAMGIEALSRGAAHAWFVESDRRALAVIDDNLDVLDLRDRATVVRSDVETALRGPASVIPDGLDLVLADPPYAFDDWSDLFALVAPRLGPDALVVAESGAPIAVPTGWEKMRERTYGGTVITFASPPDDASRQRPDDPPGAHA